MTPSALASYPLASQPSSNLSPSVSTAPFTPIESTCATHARQSGPPATVMLADVFPGCTLLAVLTVSVSQRLPPEYAGKGGSVPSQSANGTVDVLNLLGGSLKAFCPSPPMNVVTTWPTGFVAAKPQFMFVTRPGEVCTSP